MPKVPFGYRSLKEQANDDSLRDAPPVSYQYFTFGVNDIGIAKKIFVIPRGSLITTEIIVRVDDTFGQLTELSLGTSALPTSIINTVQVGAIGLIDIFTGQLGNKVATIFTSDASIFMTLISIDGVPLLGKGWGLIKYINLLGVRGYAR